MPKHKTKTRKFIGKRCNNRIIRKAINASWPRHRRNKKINWRRVQQAVELLGSCDLSYKFGKRGGVTRSNAAAALGALARYEKRTGKRLKKLGGFSRKTVNQAKKLVE